MEAKKKKAIVKDDKKNNDENVEVSEQALDVGSDEERPGVGYEITGIGKG
ncbi:hypothetical protein [Wukongibacter sp. M2B1]